MTMPGLPREPAANRIDIDGKGEVRGLFETLGFVIKGCRLINKFNPRMTNE